jgi:protein-tyrosine-phosphatase/predicted ATP-grasp superfamily ATP-dependent carboligase
VHAVHWVPDFHASPEHFLDRLLTLLESQHYELIIPTSDTPLAGIRRFYDAIREYTQVSCPPPPVLDRVLNKEETLRVARECGVPVPKTWFLEDVRASGRVEDLAFPLIAKPSGKQNEGLFKTLRVDNDRELEEAFRDHRLGREILLQTYCPGEGVGVETVFHKGEALVLFQHRRITEFPYSGGASVLAVSEAVDPSLAAHSTRLLQALEWEGAAMVEFRHDRATGQTALMEVNGRFWGSLPLSVQAGVDFPYYSWQLARGETPAPPSAYRVGLRSRWAGGDLQRVAEIFRLSGQDAALREIRWREYGRFLAEFSSGTSDMVWSARDPFPALFELAHTSLGLAKEALKSVVRKIAPRWLLRELQTARQLGAIPGVLYLRARGGTWLARRRNGPSSLPGRVESMLFICHGNIIRSALAEALVKRELPALRVRSAGVGAQPGREPDERARAVARDLGISLDGHRARPVTGTLLAEADVVFVMDELNASLLLAMHPQAQRKLRFLGEWNREAKSRVIQDPYCGSLEDVRICGRHIEVCAAELAKALRKAEGIVP